MIDVRLRLADGSQFSGVARIVLKLPQGPIVTENSVGLASEATFPGLAPGNYEVEASAPGFVTVQEEVDIEMQGSSVSLLLTMKPEEQQKPSSGGVAAPILAPKPRKELDSGLEALRRKDMQQARKHLEAALAAAPNNPDVHFFMGMLELQAKNVPAAEDHLEKAIQLFPNHILSLTVLGQTYCQLNQPQKAVPLLEKAVSLDDGSWKVHWLLGSAYLVANEPEKALQQAQRAISEGKTAAGEAEILKARAFICLGESDAAEESLRAYVSSGASDSASAKAAALLAQLEKRQQNEMNQVAMAASERLALPTVVDIDPGYIPVKHSTWAKPGVDDFVPGVAPNTPCSLPQVLGGAGARVRQLVDNLNRFSATEKLAHFTVDRSGELRGPETRSFEYVASVFPGPHGVIQVEEYRDGTMDGTVFPAAIATRGLPGMAFVFHPAMSSDFKFVCEGLGQVDGRPAWQVHFEQRADRPRRIRAYVVGKNYYSIALKGRAWIDAGTYQILRLESELIKPMPEIELMREHLTIDYRPVQFRSGGLQLWLPFKAELSVEMKKHAFYRTHSFSDFKLFNVTTEQKLQAPGESYRFANLSDTSIVGQLTVTPLPGRSLNPLCITFTIPAGQTVLKTVGLGKDVNIPSDAIGSARFLYAGAPGAVQADASLAHESVLEVVPGSQLVAAP